jgi:hypothetical protein
MRAFRHFGVNTAHAFGGMRFAFPPYVFCVASFMENRL